MTTAHKLAEALRYARLYIETKGPTTVEGVLVGNGDKAIDKIDEALRLLSEAPEPEITNAEIELAIGGSYEMPDGRKFWIDGPVAREIVRRVRACLTAALKGGGEKFAPLPLAVRLRDEAGPPLPQMIANRREQLRKEQLDAAQPPPDLLRKAEEIVRAWDWPSNSDLARAIAAALADERERAALIVEGACVAVNYLPSDLSAHSLAVWLTKRDLELGQRIRALSPSPEVD